MRKSGVLFLFTALQMFFLCFLLLHAAMEQGAARSRLRETQDLTRRLGLTDLCLVTEARYTRHPAVTDLFSAFQDSPMSFEHFPSGSVISPPRGRMRMDRD